jgi:hypothetical protein
MNALQPTHWRCRRHDRDYAKFEAETPLGGISLEVFSDSDFAPTIAIWKIGQETLRIVRAADA